MTVRRAATALQRIEILVDCENCDRKYSYTHDLLGAARSLYAPTSRAEAERRLAEKVERLRSGSFSDLPPRSCPHCSAVQSWMASAARRQAAERWGCGTSAAAAGLGLIALAAAGRLTFDLLILGALLLLALAVGAIADRVARRRWRPPNRLPGPQSARIPEIRFV